MKYLIYMIILFSSMTSKVIFDFNKSSDVQDWIVVDDVVMGGESSGTFKLNDDGFGVFEGSISLDNNGGFSSVRYRFQKTMIKECTTIIVKLRGDGKKYQFRIKSNSGDYYSYIAPFLTSGDWQEIEIPLKDMYPSFRGRRLDQPNFSKDYIEEITFLIGNKKKENFKLLIDKIVLK
ncbi:CIA30 family protein [Lutibacter sp.]|uniref:CIA30 family protein n=1 Tax=Lutibacter sp. TaxID=1925666 RepID=UPI003568E10D